MIIYCASLLNIVQIAGWFAWCGALHACQCCCVWLTYGNVSPADLLQCTRQPVVVYLLAVNLQPVLKRWATGGLLVWQSHTHTHTHTRAQYQTCCRQAEGKQPAIEATALQLFRQLNNSIMSHCLDRFHFWWIGIISTIRLAEMSLEWTSRWQTDVCSGDKQIHLAAHDLFIYWRMCHFTHRTAGIH